MQEKFCAYRFCDKPIPENRKYCCLDCSYKENGILSRKEKFLTCANPKCSTTFKVSHKGHTYCSRSCGAIVNNSKRIVDKSCERCFVSICHKGKYCDGCRYKYNRVTGEDYSVTTIGELRNRYTKYAFHAKIRGLARYIYKKDKRPMCCLICGYSKHVDICHIKAISQFGDGCYVSDVNKLENLMSLCKNHHWEFDNNFLSKEDYFTLLLQLKQNQD